MNNITQEKIQLFNNNFYIERQFIQKQQFSLEFQQSILEASNGYGVIKPQNESEIEDDNHTYYVYDKKNQDCILKDVTNREINNFIKNKMEDYLQWQPDIIKFNENFLVEIEEINRYRSTLKKVNYHILSENYTINEFDKAYIKQDRYTTQNCEDILIGYVLDKQTKEKVLEFDNVWTLIDFIQSNSNSEKGEN